MQATLFAARTNLIDAVAPRVKADPAPRRSAFESHLSSARDQSHNGAIDKDSLRTNPASGRDAKSTSESKPVDAAKPANDASPNKADAKGEEQSVGDASAKPGAKSKSPKPDDDDASADAEQQASEPIAKKKTAALATSPDAPANGTATAIQGEPAKDAGHHDGASDKQPDAAAVAVATQSTSASNQAEGDGEEQTQAISPDAAAVKPVPSDTTDKPNAAQASKQKAGATDLKPDQQLGATSAGDGVDREHTSRDNNAKQDSSNDDSSASADAIKLPEAAADKHKASAESTFDDLLAKLAPQDAAAPKPNVDRPATPQPSQIPTQEKFVADNADNVVKSVRTQLDAGGGQMRMRLDPPELGALDVAVKMVDGRMTASFTTSNEQATQLLSHSLNDLKQSLEASGITVDRIQVRQGPPSDSNAQQQPGDHRREGQSGAFEQPSGRGDQQRKEAVEKMWRKLAYGSDELDFVA